MNIIDSSSCFDFGRAASRTVERVTGNPHTRPRKRDSLGPTSRYPFAIDRPRRAAGIARRVPLVIDQSLDARAVTKRE
jgi:hypothetical protein